MNDEYYLLREATLLLKHQKNVEAAQLYEKLGHLFTQRDLYQKALAAYQKALLLAPAAPIYSAIAGIYENLNQKFLAQEALSHVPIHPPSPKIQITPQVEPQKIEVPKTGPSSSDDVIRALEKDLGIKIEALPQESPFHLKTPLEELSAESLLRGRGACF